MSYNERVKHPGILNDILFKIVFGTSSGEPTMRRLKTTPSKTLGQ